MNYTMKKIFGELDAAIDRLLADPENVGIYTASFIEDNDREPVTIGELRRYVENNHFEDIMLRLEK